MKKSLYRYPALLLCLIIVLVLAGCNNTINQADAAARLHAAVEKSNTAGVYNYLKTEFADKASGKLQRTTEVNLWAVTEESSSVPVLNEDGEYQNYKLSVKGTEKGKELWSWLCGNSSNLAETETQPMLLYSDWRSTKTPGLPKYERSKDTELLKRSELLTDFLTTDAFAPYALRAQLAELSTITDIDMDFSVPKAATKEQGALLTLVFGVSKEYLEKYKAEHGTSSVFDGTSRIEVDITYGKIQRIALFTDSTSGVFKAPKESVRWEIFYKGPRFDLPKYDDDGKERDKNGNIKKKSKDNPENNWNAAAEFVGPPLGF
ncbi:MAG: hypothetical protein LBT21_05290 [Oscillospiraceae bacterium]|jgi:hypothetical protein|nr:hypothetical protein [Oscillospiraceae bacterium]